MGEQEQSTELSIGQLGHHIGLHVTINLHGKVVGGARYEGEDWLPGVVVGLSALGDAVTIKLDQPIGGGERGGLLHHASHGEDMVSLDDPARIRAGELPGTDASALPDDVLQLIAAGKKKKAILRYRELTGATLDEAVALIGMP